MEKSVIEKGQMFLHFDKSYMEKPRVWVKVEDAVDQPLSRFVDNQALVRHWCDARNQRGVARQ